VISLWHFYMVKLATVSQSIITITLQCLDTGLGNRTGRQRQPVNCKGSPLDTFGN